MTPLDFFVLSVFVAGAALGWWQTAARRYRLLGAFGFVGGLVLWWSVSKMLGADDWDGYFFLSIALFLAGPLYFGLLLGAAGKALIRLFRG